MAWRALVGHSTIVCELGFRSVLGIVLQLMAWAAETSIGHPRLIVRLLLGVLAAFTVALSASNRWWPPPTAMMRTRPHESNELMIPVLVVSVPAVVAAYLTTTGDHADLDGAVRSVI